MKLRSSLRKNLHEAPSPESITVIPLNSNMMFSRVPKTKCSKKQKKEAVLVEIPVATI